MIKKWQIPLVLVSRHYLGSINHTLLSLEAIRQAQIPLRAIIFNGDPVPSTEQAITSRLPANCQIGPPPRRTFSPQSIINSSSSSSNRIT